MNIIAPLFFIVAILGIIFLVLRQKEPEVAAKITAVVLAAVASATAWFGGLFDKIGQ